MASVTLRTHDNAVFSRLSRLIRLKMSRHPSKKTCCGKWSLEIFGNIPPGGIFPAGRNVLFTAADVGQVGKICNIFTSLYINLVR